MQEGEAKPVPGSRQRIVTTWRGRTVIGPYPPDETWTFSKVDDPTSFDLTPPEPEADAPHVVPG